MPGEGTGPLALGMEQSELRCSAAVALTVEARGPYRQQQMLRSGKQSKRLKDRYGPTEAHQTQAWVTAKLSLPIRSLSGAPCDSGL